MSRNLKILAPVVVALAMTIGGSAFAGESYDKALYGQPDPFAAVQTPDQNTGWASAIDQQNHTELQQASRTGSAAVDWSGVTRTDTGLGEVHNPE